ncbi:hypothetical protein Tco_1442012, partial [Tanacetum coccineum]
RIVDRLAESFKGDVFEVLLTSGDTHYGRWCCSLPFVTTTSDGPWKEVLLPKLPWLLVLQVNNEIGHARKRGHELIKELQVPFCPVDKKVLDLWSPVEPNTFTVKKKEHSPNYAEYYPFGVDVFLSQRKMDHIARFLELPVVGLFLERTSIQSCLVIGQVSIALVYDHVISQKFNSPQSRSSGDESDQSQIYLLRMLQILREFSTDQVLSLYVINDIW